MTFVTICLILALYLLPSFVAAYRVHHNAVAIIVLNILLGWTVLGWVGALVWACTAVSPVPGLPDPEWCRDDDDPQIDDFLAAHSRKYPSRQVDEFLASYSREFPSHR